MKSTDITFDVQLLKYGYAVGSDFGINLNRFAGLGIGAELQHIQGMQISGRDPGNQATTWTVYDDENPLYNLLFKPFVRLKTPALNIKQLRLSAFAQPALNVQLLGWDMVTADFEQPVDHNTFKSWDDAYYSKVKFVSFSKSLSAGLEIRKNNGAFVFSYHISDQDVYQDLRTIRIKGTSLSKYLSSPDNYVWGISVGLRMYYNR
jgi:hypothetical protein